MELQVAQAVALPIVAIAQGVESEVEFNDDALMNFVRALARHHAAIDHDEEFGMKGNGHGQAIH